jgi:hypothetical protein
LKAVASDEWRETRLRQWSPRRPGFGGQASGERGLEN